MIPAAQFYIPAGQPFRQGDILLAGVIRMVGRDRYTPVQREALDEFDLSIDEGAQGNTVLCAAAGRALVMATSHDCHFDKEWNRRRSQLIRDGYSAEQAGALAEADSTLDRTFTVSPLIDPDEADADRGNLMSGRQIGYLPVPASPDGLVPESVVDLNYRCTIDRLDVRRVASTSEAARAQLRYSLARLDALRSVSLGFEIEAAVGRQIASVEVHKKNPLVVRLHLDDGSSIDLLQQPTEPGDGPGLQAAPPGPAA